MRETRTSGLMSGDGRRGDAEWPSYRAHPRLYLKTGCGWKSRRAAAGSLTADPALSGLFGAVAARVVTTPVRRISGARELWGMVWRPTNSLEMQPVASVIPTASLNLLDAHLTVASAARASG
jgi:hypothetical protein